MIPLVVQVEDEEGGRKEQFAFLRSPVRVGRGELNDLPLARPFVSTYHGIIQFDDAEARYLDLGSTNGSVLDGKPLERNQPALLGPGAELSIGTFRLTFSRRQTSERPAVRQNATMFAARVAKAVATSSAAIAAARGAPSPLAGPPTSAGRPALAPPPPPEPRPAPQPPPLDEGSRQAARRALDEGSLDLDLHYASYRGAFEHLRGHIETVLAGLGEGGRRAALEELAGRYAQLRAEPAFVALGGPGLAPPGTPGPAAAATPAPTAVPSPAAAPPAGAPRGEASLVLRAFAESYLPAAQAMETEADLELVLGRVSAALESFGRAFLELRRGHEEFGREMGVRPALGDGALSRVRDSRQLLAYVLDPRASGRERELERAFADFMLHQVALLRGVVDGAKALLGHLSPEGLAESVKGGLWPMRAAALWKAYEERFHELADEEDAVSELLFGREFARAYAATAGQPSAAPGDGEGKGPGPRGREK